MEKTIQIGERAVRFKASASFVYRYKAQFGKDILDVLMPVVKTLIPVWGKDESEVEVEKVIRSLEGLEITDLYNIIWVLAKAGDPSIPEPMEWYDGFEVFPLAEVLPDLAALLIPSLVSSKESKFKKKTPTPEQ